MIIFGWEIGRKRSKSVVGDRGNWWWPVIREPYTGAWQRNVTWQRESVLTYHAVYSCVTLIASDIAKMRLKLVQKERNTNIWTETESAAFSPVLRKPNRYQNRIQFIETWLVSKLLFGNAYILKQRDNRSAVVAMYVLDPTRTKPLVSPDGDVYYQISRDNLVGIDNDQVNVPASEIIHDVMVPLYHPLCGVSPLTACGIPAVQGLKIEQSSTKFFENGAKPGGVLTAPGVISEETAERFKKDWEEKFSGDNAGRVAVLGDGLTYQSMSVNATDSQLIEQLKWTAEAVASAFHVPAYMIGVGEPPAYNNIEALNQQYYSQCLQKLIEAIELLLDEGLALPRTIERTYGTEFDLDDLLRMDTASRVKASTDSIKGGLSTPNEERARFDREPIEGGDTIYMQEQNYSLAALAKRDAKDDPFAKNGGSSNGSAPADTADTNPTDDSARSFSASLARLLEIGSAAQSDMRLQNG